MNDLSAFYQIYVNVVKFYISDFFISSLMAFTHDILPATIWWDEKRSSLPLKSFTNPPASITRRAPAAKSQSFIPYPRKASSLPEATKAKSNAVEPVLLKVKELE